MYELVCIRDDAATILARCSIFLPLNISEFSYNIYNLFGFQLQFHQQVATQARTPISGIYNRPRGVLAGEQLPLATYMQSCGRASAIETAKGHVPIYQLVHRSNVTGHVHIYIPTASCGMHAVTIVARFILLTDVHSIAGALSTWPPRTSSTRAAQGSSCVRILSVGRHCD